MDRYVAMSLWRRHENRRHENRQENIGLSFVKEVAKKLQPKNGLRERLPQHPDEHRPERPVFLAVDQELGERPRLWVPPELSDPVGAIEVGSIRTWSSSALGAGKGWCGRAEGSSSSSHDCRVTMPEHEEHSHARRNS